jgi:type IV secretory pathway TrbD component
LVSGTTAGLEDPHMSAIAALKAARAAGLQLRVWLVRHRVRPVAARQDPRAVAEQNDAVEWAIARR